jgi:cytochrome c553
MQRNKVKTYNNPLFMYSSVQSFKNKLLLLIILFMGVIVPVYPGVIQEEDSVLSVHREFSAEDLIRGERLFFGLVYRDAKSINCASCHNISVSDTLNWNPDAIDVSAKYLNKSASDLSKVLLRPAGKKMMEVHKDFQISPEDIVMIKGYMDQLVPGGLIHHKPVITNLLLFIIATVLILFSITDLIIFRKLKHQWINYILLLAAGGFIVYTLAIEAIAIGRSQNYSPDQPIKFSHAVHAGQNQTDCIYCHSSAPYSKSAGIPPENVCMNCHLLVRNGTRSGAFEIAKIISSYESRKPIEWVKIHNLPDHVFFSHAQHVSAGGVNCSECHGEVQKMNVVVQVKDLSMGWCLDCHRTRKVDFSNNKFYSEYEALAEKVRNGTLDSVTVEMIGGRECMKCHY